MHRIVAECWLGDRPEGYEIDHIDRNTHNNKYTNLRYVTHSVQMKNRVLTEKMINIILTNWSNAQVLEAGAMGGAIFETFVVSEIIKSYNYCNFYN